jgi:GDP/UDP-N,N'-diacetylbacillosamine 2-epimerase (hydrolysing)
MRKTVCFVTGSRADFGLMCRTIKLLKSDPRVEIKLVVTGSHLSSEFGETIEEIRTEEIKIDRTLEILYSTDSEIDIANSISKCISGLAAIFADLDPSIVVILGDRYEAFGAAIAAYILRIPIAHIHGGEITSGALDEAFRHSITKMSNLHFCASETYKNRIIQLGETPESVHNVGGLGVDNILSSKLLNKYELETNLNIKLGNKNLLITYHPETRSVIPPKQHMMQILSALSEFQDITLFFTHPNSDSGGLEIINMITEYTKGRNNVYVFKSLGHTRYLSLLKHVDGVVGNSSSGILEAPSFRKGTVNIGSRQAGRLQAESIINCSSNKDEIVQSIKMLYSVAYKESLEKVVNPYGNGGASKSIAEIISNLQINDLLAKEFFDLPSPRGYL